MPEHCAQGAERCTNARTARRDAHGGGPARDALAGAVVGAREGDVVGVVEEAVADALAAGQGARVLGVVDRVHGLGVCTTANRR